MSEIQEEIQNWFNIVDHDKNGRITAQELQTALLNGQGRTFSTKACDLMVRMFSKSKNRTIVEAEFRELYAYIHEWMAAFRKYDSDQSGVIDEKELGDAFQQMGFRVPPEFVKIAIGNSENGKMSVDEFIVASLQLYKLTEAFKVRDEDRDGVVTLGFEDFVNIVLECCF